MRTNAALIRRLIGWGVALLVSAMLWLLLYYSVYFALSRLRFK